MEKNYLRYAPQWFAGIITSPRAPVAALPNTKEVVCGAGRDVVCWRVRTGERTRTLRRGDETDLVGASPLDGPRGEVVAVAAAVDGSIAAACASGLVRVWRGDADTPQAHDHHRAAVQALRWCPFAATLVTGGARSACRAGGRCAGGAVRRGTGAWWLNCKVTVKIRSLRSGMYLPGWMKIPTWMYIRDYWLPPIPKA